MHYECKASNLITYLKTFEQQGKLGSNHAAKDCIRTLYILRDTPVLSSLLFNGTRSCVEFQKIFRSKPTHMFHFKSRACLDGVLLKCLVTLKDAFRNKSFQWKERHRRR